ncbi:ATP-binding protein [Streptomyces sp. APSN-46.1]|uniref:ATP-binding protein n=1 Tax=Streptomyces sp. APSN-46.1 TaxID=2929049 RepID=UPI0027E3BCFE|nr:ATP-binding protein [Streptomyces sp. APSN-46.1]
MLNPNGPSAELDDGLVVRRWNRDPRCVGRARTELRKALADWGLAQIEDDALLVVSELLTNAGRHARTAAGREIETRYVRLPAGVRIEVHDAAPGRPEVLPADPERDCGRGPGGRARGPVGGGGAVRAGEADLGRTLRTRGRR